MAIPTILSVVNGCLATMGESPLNELEPDHPYVQAALAQLDSALVLELGRGWWFNTDQVQLVADATNGNVYLSEDILSIDTAWTQLVQRGTRMYDRTNSTYDLRDFMTSQAVAYIQGVVIRNLSFADLPLPAKFVVAFRTQLDFQGNYDADSQRYRELGGQYQQAFNTLKSQDIRNSNVNVFRSAGVADKLRRINPFYATTGGLKRMSSGGYTD